MLKKWEFNCEQKDTQVPRRNREVGTLSKGHILGKNKNFAVECENVSEEQRTNKKDMK